MFPWHKGEKFSLLSQSFHIDMSLVMTCMIHIQYSYNVKCSVQNNIVVMFISMYVICFVWRLDLLLELILLF